MKDDTIAHLYDVIQAGKTIKRFLSECSYEEYKKQQILEFIGWHLFDPFSEPKKHLI